MICPSCQTDNQDEPNFCVNCGYRLVEETAVSASQPLAPTTEIASATSHQTVPLAEADIPPKLDDLTHTPAKNNDDPDLKILDLPYEPLPEGALIGQAYLITQALHAEADIHYYYATDNQGQNYFLVKECNHWRPLRTEIEVINKQITGDGLQPPLQAFKQRIGRMRYYIILPPPGAPFDQINPPLETPQALAYGESLARGLDRLHQANIAFGPVLAERIMVEGNTAYLADFADCRLTEQSNLRQQEVIQLAHLIYTLLTGQQSYSPQASLSDATHQLFNQLLNNGSTMNASDLANAFASLRSQARRPAAFDLRVGCKTDVGVQRQLNEDSFCALGLIINNQSINQPTGLYVVADGMGGHEGGEVASGLTIRTIAHLATQGLFNAAASGGQLPNYEQWLTQAIATANTAVYEKSQQSKNDMGTTVVAALAIGNQIHLAHVGDSRAYHVTAGGIIPATTDHSLVERLVATGQITPEEARYHPQSNVIYRTIGDKPNVEVDYNSVTLQANEYLLLCSDGLNGMILDETIHQIVVNADHPQAACDALIKAANAAGGDDNVTVVLIKLESL